LALDREVGQRLRLDLPDALARQSEPVADRRERHRLTAAEPVAQDQDLLLALPEALDRAPERVLAQAELDLLLDAEALARQEVAVGRARVLPHGLVEARDSPSDMAHLAHLLERQLRRTGDLLLARRPPELGHEVALGARDLLLALDDVHRDADRARLVR